MGEIVTTRAQYTFLAEMGLLCMSLTVIFSFSRIFVGGDWLWPLIITAVLTHWVSATWRNIPAPTSIQIAAVLVGTTTAAAWLLAPETMRFWLPSANTFHRFGELLNQAAHQYTQARAPIEATDGFVLATIVGVVVVGLMAEIGTFTIFTPLQAIIPMVTLFGLTSVLGNGRNATFFTLMFVASATMFFLGYNRSLFDVKRTRWVNHSADETNSTLLRSGVILATITLAVIAVVGPALPDTLERAWWSWHEPNASLGAEGDRQIISPLVDIQGRLVNQSREIAFTVESPQGAYWRLMALDQFDGQTWQATSRFRSVNGRFDLALERGDELMQQVRIETLSSDYLPAAARPVAVFTANRQVAFDDHSTALLLEHRTEAGFEYVVNSVLPTFDSETLRTAPTDLPGALAERYLQLPELDPRIYELATELTQESATPYDAALALQNFFRTEFAYDIDIDSGSGETALTQFLFEDRRGYCEQFAASYAAMARSIGLAARVAVGFTEGDQSPTDPTQFIVRGKHSHAWPEVYFPSIGWVPFEPTPGRYSPGSEAWTALSAEVAEEENEAINTEVETPPALPSDDFFLPEDIFPEFETGAVNTPDDAQRSTTNSGLRLLAMVLATVVGWVIATSGVRRLHRWWQDRQDRTAKAKILRAWQRVERSYARRDSHRDQSETYAEFANRIASDQRRPQPRLEALANLATEAHFAPLAPEGSDVALMQRLSDEEVRELRHRRSWPERLLDAARPRLN